MCVCVSIVVLCVYIYDGDNGVIADDGSVVVNVRCCALRPISPQLKSVIKVK